MKTLSGTRPATPVPPAAAPPSAPAHLSDPILASALFAAWNGDPFVVVAAPPGAGKTRLVTHLAQQLQHRAGLDVAIAAQTRAQALDVTNRAAAAGAKVSLFGKSNGKITPRPPHLNPQAGWIHGQTNLRTFHGVAVATTQRWLHTPGRAWKADILIADEAWQLTFADLCALGELAPQIILVGDPGQIAPVVTGDTSRWQHAPTGPHLPAPTALAAAYPDAITHLSLPHTWRLGPDTTALIQPAFYPELPFTSARPPRALTINDEQLPEITATPINAAAGPNDPALAAAAATQVRRLLADAQLRNDQEHRPLTARDIAVIAPHVSQATMIAAHLTDLDGLLVGTINQTQGLQREAVVVLHPLAGYRHLTQVTTDTGRLCVALSRHRTHAHVLYDPATPATLQAAMTEDPGDTSLMTQQHILRALTTKVSGSHQP